MNLFSKVINILQIGDDQKELSTKTLWSLFIQVGAAGLVFISNIILARIMGVKEYGSYTFAISLALLLSGIATSGFVNLLLRRTAAYTETEEYSLLKGLIGWCMQYIIIIAAIITLITCLIFMLFNFTNVPDTTPMLIAVLSVPLISFLIFYQSTLNGGHFIVQSQLPEKIIKPSLIILLVTIIYSLSIPNINALTCITINFIATLFALAIAYLSFRKNILTLTHDIASEYQTPEWANNYRSLFLLGILSIINSRLDVLMLGFMRSPEEVGVYNASSRLSEFVSFSLFVINIGLAPMISKLYASKQISSLQKLVTKTSRITLLIALPIILILLFGGRYILSLFGPDFILGYNCLIILAGAQLVSILAGSSGYLLTMTGNENSATGAMIISLLINVLLNILLIPKFGIIGAAYSTAVSTIAWNICMAVMARIKTGINPTFIGK